MLPGELYFTQYLTRWTGVFSNSVKLNSLDHVFTELANTMNYRGGVLYNIFCYSIGFPVTSLRFTQCIYMYGNSFSKILHSAWYKMVLIVIISLSILPLLINVYILYILLSNYMYKTKTFILYISGLRQSDAPSTLLYHLVINRHEVYQLTDQIWDTVLMVIVRTVFNTRVWNVNGAMNQITERKMSRSFLRKHVWL